jgi:hypothetical protein
MQNHENENVRNIGQGEARHGKYTKTNKLRDLNPQANYTDRATATCR